MYQLLVLRIVTWNYNYLQMIINIRVLKPYNCLEKTNFGIKYPKKSRYAIKPTNEPIM